MRARLTIIVELVSVNKKSHLASSLGGRSLVRIRVDQNTGGALLESPMRTARHGKFRVLSTVSVELN